MKPWAFVFVWAAVLGASRGPAAAAGPAMAYRLNRGYARVRPYVGASPAGFTGERFAPAGGAIADLGVGADTASGFHIGFELAPLTVTAARPQITARLALGYANEQLSISMGIGSGLTWLYPQAGPVIRIGRHDGPHAILRLSFSLYPPQPLPSDLDLELVVPVHRRVRLDLDVGGGYGNVIGVYATGGTQIVLATREARASSLLTVGAGVSWVQYTLGPTVLLGFEQRF